MQPKTAQCKTTEPHKLDPVPVEVSLGYNEQQPDEPSLSPQNMQSRLQISAGHRTFVRQI